MRAWILMGVLLALSAGCEKPLGEPPPQAAEKPGLVFEGFQAFGSRGEAREWQAWAEKAEVYNGRKEALAYKLKVDYYQKGKVVSVLRADLGRINTSSQDVTATGNVVLRGENGVVLTTQNLYWDHARERIHTPDAVRVEREDTVMTGIGLVSDRTLGSVEVLQDVRIEAKNVESLRGLREEFDRDTP